MTIAMRPPTETELAALERRRKFHDDIAAKAAALLNRPAPVVQPAIPPEAVAAETDPPRKKPWFWMIGVTSPVPMVAEVKAAIANEFGVTVGDLASPRRNPVYVLPRQAAMWLCKEMIPGKSYPSIGRAFGGRDHTTVLHACRTWPGKMDRNPDLAARVAKVRGELEFMLAGRSE